MHGTALLRRQVPFGGLAWLLVSATCGLAFAPAQMVRGRGGTSAGPSLLAPHLIPIALALQLREA